MTAALTLLAIAIGAALWWRGLNRMPILEPRWQTFTVNNPNDYEADEWAMRCPSVATITINGSPFGMVSRISWWGPGTVVTGTNRRVKL